MALFFTHFLLEIQFFPHFQKKSGEGSKIIKILSNLVYEWTYKYLKNYQIPSLNQPYRQPNLEGVLEKAPIPSNKVDIKGILMKHSTLF